MRSVEGDPMVWPHPQDVILYARSSYYYDNMFILCLFRTFFLILKPIFTLVNVNAPVVATTSWWLHFSTHVVA